MTITVNAQAKYGYVFWDSEKKNPEEELREYFGRYLRNQGDYTFLSINKPFKLGHNPRGGFIRVLKDDIEKVVSDLEHFFGQERA